MPSSSQVISVKIGAVLENKFEGVFSKADRAVRSLTKVVKGLDSAFDAAKRGLDSFTTSLSRNNRQVLEAGKRAGALSQAYNQQRASQGQLIHDIHRMTAAWQQATKARSAWTAAMRRPVPALPSRAMPPVPSSRGGVGAVPASVGGARGGKRKGAPAGSTGRMEQGFGELVGGSSILYGLDSMLGSSGELEASIVSTLKTAELPMERLHELQTEIFRVGKLTKQLPMDVSEAVLAMSETGLGFDKGIRPILDLLGQVSTASDSAFKDIGLTSAAFQQQMGIGANVADQRLLFETLMKGGKEGRFELRNMAKEAPNLLARASASGDLKGMEGVRKFVALAQAVAQQSGNAEQAATNIENLFNKINAYETHQVFQQRFDIDYGAALKRGRAQGKAGLDILLEQAQKATGGDMSKLPLLMVDSQAQAALRAALTAKNDNGQNIYQSLPRDLMPENVTGVFAEDMAKTLRTFEARKRGFVASVNEMVVTIGNAWRTVAVPVMNSLEPIVQKITAWTQANPKLADSVLGVAGAVGALGVAFGAAELVLGPLVGGVTMLGGVFAKLGALNFLKNIRMLAGFGLATGGVQGLAAALAAAAGPAVAIGAALVGGALLVRKYWEPIKAFFSGFGSGMAEALQPVVESFGALWQAVQPIASSLFESLMSLLEPLGLTKEEFDGISSAGKKVGVVVGSAIRLILKPVELLVKGLTQISDWMSKQGGEDMRGQRVQGNASALSGYEAARKKLIGAGVWTDQWGRDTVDIGGVQKMMAAGDLSAAELKLLAAGQNMDGVARGNTVEDSYVGALRLLAAAAAKREAGGQTTIQQTNTTNVTVNGAQSPAGVVDEIERRKREIAKGHAGDARLPLRGSFHDNNSPQTVQ